jgi:dephospho-CoA kinase
MRIIGLTGSIGMGKSTLANQFRFIGVPVHDADKTVHKLMSAGGLAFNAVQRAFPECITSNTIDRKKLGAIVFHNSEKREILEDILHPLVRQSSAKFIAQCRARRLPLCVLDIPLLFETGRNADMDEIICVTAPAWVQRRRVLSRPDMTVDRFKSIVKTQIPDYRKRCLSDHVVITAKGHRHTLNTIKRIKNEQ